MSSMPSQNIDKLMHTALAQMNAGQLDEASLSIESAINRAANRPDAHVVQGLIHKRKKNWVAAERNFERARELAPDYLDATHHLGKLWMETGQHEKAISLLFSMVETSGREDALAVLGESIQATSRWPELFELCRRVLSKEREKKPEFLWQAGKALAALGRPDEAEHLFQQISNDQPQWLKATLRRAELAGARALRGGKNQAAFQDAVQCYQAVLQARPDLAELHNNLGVLLGQFGQLNAAAACYRAAIGSGSNGPLVRRNLADTLYNLGQLEEAVALFADLEKEQQLGLEQIQSMNYIRQKLCDWSHLTTLDQQLLKPGLQHQGALPLVPFPFLVYPLAITEAEQGIFAQHFSEYVLRGIKTVHTHQARDQSGRLRIGYLSADFHNHATAHLIRGLFSQHNRSRFEIYAYSLGIEDGSNYRQKLKQDSDHFIDLAKLDDDAAAQRIYDDQLDILIDLKGYTRESRAGILARRPAPIQIAWLGYPGAMNAPFIDYILTDKIVTPPEQQVHYRERFAYLPHCYQINDADQEIADPVSRQQAGLPEQGFVFCSFSGLYKIEPEIFAVWMRLLHAVPDSILWLMDGPQTARNNLCGAAEQAGINASRLIFAPKKPKAEHLARQQCADLFLDTWRCNGHTTMSDALWAGVPSITCPGQTFATRVGASLLHAMGMPELIAGDLAAYEQLALDLARHPEKLQLLRERIWDTRRDCALFDTAGFVQALENQLATLRQTHTIPVAEVMPSLQVASPPSANISPQQVPLLQAPLLDQALKAYSDNRNDDCRRDLIAALNMGLRADALTLLGMLERREGHLDASNAAYSKAVNIDPNYADAWNNWGNLHLNDRDDIAAALACFDKAIPLRPQFCDAIANRGRALRELNRHEEVVAAMSTVIAIQPDNADAHWDLALALLNLGRLREGWTEYEWRWRRRQPEPRDFSQPQWEGQAISGQTLLLHAEQGYGDTLQFLRFATMAKARSGAKIVLEVQAALVNLLANFDSADQVIGRGADLPAFDYHVPLITLAKVFDIQNQDLSGESYLTALPALKQKWQSLLKPGKRPRLGLIWAGNPNVKNDKRRSPRLAPLWDLLLARSDIDFYVLQQGDGRRDMDGLQLPEHVIDIARDVKDFADTAALMQNMDAVISSDTSTAHLAGALGVKTAILHMHTDDWRWLHQRRDSPWYASVTLLRQRQRGDWVSVVEQLAQWLPSPPKALRAAQAKALNKTREQLASKAPAVSLPAKTATPADNRPAELFAAFEAFQRNDNERAYVQINIALSRQTGIPEAWVLKGILERRRGQNDAAIACYQQALQLQPDLADAWNNLANAYKAKGDLENAALAFAKALQINPNASSVALTYADVLREQNHLDAVQVLVKEWLQREPANAEWWNQQGNLLHQQKHSLEALQAYEKACKLKPDFADGWYNQGVVLQGLERQRDAVAIYQHVLKLMPQHSKSHFNIGIAYQKLGEMQNGQRHYELACELNPQHFGSRFNLGALRNYRGQTKEAIAEYRKALAIKPDSISPLAEIAHLRQKLCDWSELDQLHDSIVLPSTREHSSELPVSPFMFQVWPAPISEAEQYAIARLYADSIEQACPPAFNFSARQAGARLRIGYVSADLHNHATSHLMLGLFKRHDRTKFEVFAYSMGPDDRSNYRQRVQTEVEHFIDISTLGPRAAAERIYSDGIDLLIDLKGYTRDARAEIFAFRPAPVQIGWLGYPGTTASRFLDYMITDRRVNPPETQAWYSEVFAYMPHSYQINDDEQAIADTVPGRSECGLPESGFVFCCFCTLYKIEPVIFTRWMNILKAVPGSVLWLIDGEAETMNNLRNAAQTQGVAAERLIFAPKMNKPEHLARHCHADLFLDSWCCNAHTTASDALWAGLPVLTCPGETFATRVGASLMHAIEMPELICRDLNQYEQQAIAIANDPERLQQLKTTLAAKRRSAPLFDTARFVVDLEQLYTQLWQKHDTEEIVVLHRNAGMGDIMMLTPIARELKANGKRRVAAHVAPVFAQTAVHCPDFDDVIVNDEALAALKQRHQSCGHRWTEQAVGRSFFAIANEHQINAYAKACGVAETLQDRSLRMTIPAEAHASLNAHFIRRGIVAGRNSDASQKRILLHPALGDPNRTWPAEHWQKLYTELKNRGHQVWCIGHQRDGDPAKRVSDFDIQEQDNWINQLSIVELAALCTVSDVLVSTDSGPLHIGGCTDIALVGLFSVAKAEYRLPWRHGVAAWNSVAVTPDCAFYPCYPKMSDEQHTQAFLPRLASGELTGQTLIAQWCLQTPLYHCLQHEISVEKVLTAIDKALENQSAMIGSS